MKKKAYQPPAIISVGSAIDLTKGGNSPVADIPGNPSGGYNRGWGGPDPDDGDKQPADDAPQKPGQD